MVNINDPIDSNIIEVNKKLYVDAEYIYEYLKDIFEELKDDAPENIINDLEFKIDTLLEKIEFNEWEYN